MSTTLTGPAYAIEAAVIGRIVCISESGQTFVRFGDADAEPRPSRSGVPITIQHVGREVVLVFEGGSPDKPVIVGVLEPASAAGRSGEATELAVRVDGTRVVISAESEIVLQCGASSMTLTRAGKILIRGAYLSSRASGVHRIMGATVEIN